MSASTTSPMASALLGPDDVRDTIFDAPDRWDAYYTLALYEGRLEVRVPIYVEFDVDAAVIERWRSGINLKWNEQFDIVADYGPDSEAVVPISAHGTETPAEVCPQEFRVRLVFVPEIYVTPNESPPASDPDLSGTEFFNRIRGECAPGDRCNKSHWPIVDGTGGPANTVENTVGHEFGHLIANTDEYQLSAGEFFDITGRLPTEDDKDGHYIQLPHPPYRQDSYAVKDSLMGVSTELPHERHVQRFADWLAQQLFDGANDPNVRVERSAGGVCPGDPRSAQDWTWHTVQEGEWISKIAADYGFTSWRELYAWDAGLGPGNENFNLDWRSPRSSKYPEYPHDPDLIYPDEQLRVPLFTCE